MKKNFFYLAIAALTLSFAACSNDDDDSSSNSVKVETTTISSEQRDKAITLNFSSEDTPLEKAIFSETGRAVLVRKLSELSSEAATRAFNEDEVIVGTYTVSNGTYTIVSGNKTFKLRVENQGGASTKVYFIDYGSTEETEMDASVEAKVVSNDITNALCREWGIVATRLRHKGSVTAVKQFEGSEASSLNAILDYAKTKANINEEFSKDMVISSVIFTNSGSVVFLFDNGEFYTGKWSIGSNDVISYKWDKDDMGNRFENGSATFTTGNYKQKGYYILTLTADIDDDASKGEYTVELSFYLSEK